MLLLSANLYAEDLSAPSAASSILPASSPAVSATAENFEWGPALKQTFSFLAFQHAFRFAIQPGTRARLSGPFFKDYVDSVKALEGWGDDDNWVINYVAHPLSGAITGHIQIQNDPRGRKLRWGDEGYWHSRGKALAWNTAYSVQWELGPISESSLGNVGQRKGTQGYVDLVMTPLGGFAINLAEDATDRWLERWENGRSRKSVRTLRMLLNPGRTFGNIARGKAPWFRDTRP